MKDIFGREFHPTEMYRLINMLIEQKARFRVEELYGFPCVRFYNESGIEIGDAICHIGSYGHEDGLIEVMGLNIDKEKDGCRVKGWLTAEDVIDMLMDTKGFESEKTNPTGTLRREEHRQDMPEAEPEI